MFAVLFAKYGAKMTVEEVALAMRFSERDIKFLAMKKQLKALGKPKNQSVKWYSTHYIAELIEDASWLDKAVQMVQTHNTNRRSCA